MQTALHRTAARWLLAASFGLGTALGAQAQLLAPAAPARSYEFLHVTVTEATTDNLSKLLLSPAFNGRTEIQLEGLNAFLPAKRLELLRRNEETISRCLGELSAAGWELLQVYSAPLVVDKDVSTTRYLLHRAK